MVFPRFGLKSYWGGSFCSVRSWLGTSSIADGSGDKVLHVLVTNLLKGAGPFGHFLAVLPLKVRTDRVLSTQGLALRACLNPLHNVEASQKSSLVSTSTA